MMMPTLVIFATFLVSCGMVVGLSRLNSRNISIQRFYDIAVPIMFGIAMIVLWEMTVRLYNIPSVLLPAIQCQFYGLTFAKPI